MADYANDALVETDWVQDHLDEDDIRIVEVDENPALYAEAHIPGAIGFDWKQDLQDQVKRDFLDPEEFGKLMGSRGISSDHTVLLYGDRNNWFAAYTYWYFRYYGHDKVKLINAYCRIGERSAHTWFVLHELLGEGNVKNYDGSWTEWGNLVNVPIEKDV